MDRQLASAIIATFRDADAVKHRNRLERFGNRQWRRSSHWLDASGLALYFLQRLGALNIEDAVPEAVLSELKRRHADNRERTTFLLREFVGLNSALRHAGLRYANLKGFTLAPDYCPDLTLRYQTDLDFLIEAQDAARCRETLTALGYAMIAGNRQVMEFKTEIGRTPHLRDLYKVRPQRSVEVHLCDANCRGLLQRAGARRIDGDSYPALSAEDMFLSQASHLFRHLRSEWTRVSWLLEFKQFVKKRREDAEYWHSVRVRAMQDTEAVLAVGVSVRMVERAFGSFAPDELASWSACCVPPPVALWIEHCGDEVLLADFPGSKLYLLLERAIHGDDRAALVREKLLPGRAPAPIMATRKGGLVARLRAAVTRWSYFLFRLRFHLRSGAAYLVASRGWSRLLKASTRQSPIAPEYAAHATD